MPSSSSKARIGIVLTLGDQEARKGELIDIRRKLPLRPWAALAPENLRIDREGKVGGVDKGQTIGIPGDVSMGAYISAKYGHTFDVDFIEPKDISAKRLKGNDINFLLTYDLLEAFHTDKKRGPNKMAVFNTLSDVLRKADNVFPNYDFQQFVYSKLLYYSHFTQMGLPILPTITLSQAQWKEQVAKKGGPKAVAREVMEDIKRRGMKWFIIKPVYGQEAKGCMSFETDDMDFDEFTNYLGKLLGKYPGLIIQTYVDGFGHAKSPEIRFFFVGRKYQYAVVATPGKQGALTLKEEGNDVARPVGSSGGWIRVPKIVDVQKMKNIAQKAIDHMPDISLKKRSGKNIDLPYLMTRVDMGCIRDKVFNPWINEVEFVPSLYLEDHTWPIDAHMGEQMVKITKMFLGMSGSLQKRRVSSMGYRFKRGAAAKFASKARGQQKPVRPNLSKLARALSIPFSTKRAATKTADAKGKRSRSDAHAKTISRRVIKKTLKGARR
jgi:hypothetical protein